MKRIIFILALVAAFAFESKAQKFALIDMEYILKNIPSYEMANEQLKQVSQRWEKEITTQAQKVESMYKEYQSNSVFLSDDQKKKKEEESLMKPIQDDIYNAVKQISETKGYQMVMDRASSANIIFASPRIDISNEVLAKLGYSK